MHIPLKYGHSTLTFDIDGLASHVDVLASGRACPECDETTLIKNALARPIGSPPLADLVSPGQRVVIVTSDVTRPCPSVLLLPHVLDELNRGGVRDHDITAVFGLGTHRSQTDVERTALVGEQVYRCVKCIDSDPADVRFIGCTRPMPAS